MKRPFVALGVATIMVLALLPDTASAHTFVASPRLTINKVPAGATDPGERIVIYGKILSRRVLCRNARVVRLLRAVSGPDVLLATDITDREGEYRFVRRPRRDQTLYTTIRRLVRTSYGHSHVCRRARSSNLFVNVT
jgi:hypothetical protein